MLSENASMPPPCCAYCAAVKELCGKTLRDYPSSDRLLDSSDAGFILQTKCPKARQAL